MAGGLCWKWGARAAESNTVAAVAAIGISRRPRPYCWAFNAYFKSPGVPCREFRRYSRTVRVTRMPASGILAAEAALDIADQMRSEGLPIGGVKAGVGHGHSGQDTAGEAIHETVPNKHDFA